MNEKRYRIIDKYGHILAENMSLDIATVLIKGFADVYFNEELNLKIEEDIKKHEGGIDVEQKQIPHWC